MTVGSDSSKTDRCVVPTEMVDAAETKVSPYVPAGAPVASNVTSIVGLGIGLPGLTTSWSSLVTVITPGTDMSHALPTATGFFAVLGVQTVGVSLVES